MKKVEAPTYFVELPGLEQKVAFRPYLVKEERNLLLAIETKDFDTILNAIKEICTACTFGKVDINTLSYFDLELLFINLRSKSVSEELELIGSCECADDAQTDFVVSLDDAKIIDYDKKKKQIKIPESDMTLQMRYPSVDEMITIQEVDAAKIETVDAGVVAVASCIVKSWTDEEVFDNSTIEEKIEYIDSIPRNQYEPIKKFFEEMPKVRIDGSFTCCKCSKVHNVQLTGLESFFG